MAKEQNKLKSIDAPLFSYWSALYQSFYSKRLYIDVGKRWRHFGIGYVLLLIALWSIPFAVKVGLDFDIIYKQQLTDPLSTIPTLLIQNGEVSFDKPMPYIVKNKQEQVVLIVDTTDKINSFLPEYPYLSVLINKNSVAFRMPELQFPGIQQQHVNPNKPIIQTFDKGESLIFDGKRIVEQNDFKRWKYIVTLLVYPVVFAVFFSLFIVLFFTFGFLGQLFARIFFSFQMSVKQSITLLVVAVSPAMWLLLGLLLFNLTFPGYGFLLVGVLALYFSFATYSLKSESRQLVRL